VRFYFVRVLIKYSSPIESWLEFSNELWGKGLKNFLHQYVEHQPDNSGASFRIMKTHRAFNLGLKGLLVRDEWDITWDFAVKARAGGFSNFIIVGQTGIGVHHFLHIFFLPSGDITHQGRLSLFTTFLQGVWPSVSQHSFKTFLTMYGSSTGAGFAPLPVKCRGWRYGAFRRTTLLGPSSIQIRLSKTLPLFYTSMNHHFSLWKQRLVSIDGLGRNTTGILDSSTRILSRWKKSFGVRTYICSVR